MRLSVIVPVYRVPGEMLRACVDSLLRQPVPEMELLFVVDGADDASLPILNSLASTDARIHVLTQTVHQGVSAARNRGLEAAQGEWIGFADADDWVEPDMYTRLLALAEEQHCDVAGCRLTYDEPGRGDVLHVHSFAGIWDMADDAGAAHIYLRAGLSCCTKLCSRDLAVRFRFPEERRNLEDGLYLTRMLASAKRVGFLDQAFYHARYRPESAQHCRMDWARFESYYQSLSALAEIVQPLAENSGPVRTLWAWQLLALSIGARRCHEGLPPKAQAQAWRMLQAFIRDLLQNWGSLYPLWLRRLLRQKVQSSSRLFNGGHLFYSLLWQQIRAGTAALRGESAWLMVRDLGNRVMAKVRR